LDYVIQNKIQISLRATCPIPFLAGQYRETPIPTAMPKPLSGREIPVAVPKSLQESANELALKIVLAVVGLLFIALGNL
jgi:hypothetical protein